MKLFLKNLNPSPDLLHPTITYICGVTKGVR